MRRMRGQHREPDSMFSYISPEQRIPVDHPLRMIRAVVDEVLADMSRESTGCMPRRVERRFRRSGCCARSCCQIFYSIRSELLLLEQLNTTCCFASSSA